MEKKFSQRWSNGKKLYDKQENETKENKQKKFKNYKQKNVKRLNFMEAGTNYVRQLQNFLNIVIQKYYNEAFINNDTYYRRTVLRNTYFDNSFNKNYEIFFNPKFLVHFSFMTDEIESLLTQSPRRTDCDLTKRYFNIKMLEWLKSLTIDHMSNYLETLLERYATMLAQKLQFQKVVTHSSVKESLDKITFEVLNCLREKHPDHSIFSMPAEDFHYRINDENCWNETEGAKIINSIGDYLLGKLNFQLNKSKELKYMCIDYVLENKCGEELILLIICHSVANRLGLHFKIILEDSDRRLYLGHNWHSLEMVTYFTVRSNEFPGGFMMQRLSLNGTILQITSEKKIMLYLTEYSHLKSEIWKYSKILQVTLQKKESQVHELRPRAVKFAVGTIVTHKHQSTDCSTGVIIGWHYYKDRNNVTFSRRNGENISDYYVMPLKVYNTCSAEQQTHYLILTENNEMCYVQEDAITLTTPKWIENSEIGRYFCKFEGTHYVPNKMLARLFPHNVAITVEAISKNPFSEIEENVSSTSLNEQSLDSLDIIREEDIDKQTSQEIQNNIDNYFDILFEKVSNFIKNTTSTPLTTQTSKIVKNVIALKEKRAVQMQVKERQENINIETYDITKLKNMSN
ncbi:uncharacterized protein [Anoplolepis gracilipes]|uniref:uncharacterized protein n=1 Tax=Anoplolepis gracilipes TaxID=354296 RepID=UPI003B9EF057